VVSPFGVGAGVAVAVGVGVIPHSGIDSSSVLKNTVEESASYSWNKTLSHGIMLSKSFILRVTDHS